MPLGTHSARTRAKKNKTKRGTGDGKGYLGSSPRKSKGTGKGKYGKKGKMNELVYENETTDNDNDWWTQSDTDAWWHAWNSHDWDEPDPDAWWTDENPTEGTQANDMEEPGQAVGSLVLSPLLLACSTEPSCGDLSLSDAHVLPVPPASHDSLSVPWELQGLICTAPRRIRVVQCACWYEQFANQTMSCAKRFEQFVPCVEPFLAELALNDDMNWWLLDSGASVTVLSETFAKSYGAQTKSLTVGERFRAANGTSVTMKGLASLNVDLLMFDETNGKEHWKSASLEVHVGSTSHNILSTTHAL